MSSRAKRFLAAGITVAVIGVGAGVSIAMSTDDNDVPITGEALERASQAAIEHVGGGTVTDTEVGDEEGAYEVEITRADGSQVDVHLDENFGVLGTEADDESPDDGEDDGS